MQKEMVIAYLIFHSDICPSNDKSHENTSQDSQSQGLYMQLALAKHQTGVLPTQPESSRVILVVCLVVNYYAKGDSMYDVLTGVLLRK
jgi:hypothetical protein